MSSLAHNSIGSSSGLSLALRLQREDSSAWFELVELYGPLVDSWATAAGLNKATRQDIAQEVFLLVHRSISQFDATLPKATFKGWLWRITRNVVLQHIRKINRQPREGSTAAGRLAEFADPWAGSSDDDPPSSIDETTALVRRAMRQIESRVDRVTWQAFFRTTINGERSTDVATDLGLSPAAVRKAKSRTLQRLRKQLGEQT